MFNLFGCIECSWHPGTFSEQDSLVFHQKIPLALAQENCLLTDPLLSSAFINYVLFCDCSTLAFASSSFAGKHSNYVE